MVRDCQEAHHGRCSVRLTAGENGRVATLVQMVSAAEFAGSRVVLSAWVRTDAAQAAQLWLRVDAGRTVVAFDNMGDRPISGTEPWTEYRLALDVPDGASALAFGVLLRGGGRVRADDFALTIESRESAASTDILRRDQVWRHATDIGPSKLRARPLNLDFEQE